MIVVIHKKWAMILLCVVGLITASFISYEEFFAPNEFDPIKGFEERISSTKVHSFSWESYLEDCGSLRVLRNQFRADDDFDRKYKYNLVEWTGYYAGHDEYLIDQMNVKGIKIKMEPTDTNTLADLLLTKIIPGSQDQIDAELDIPIKGDLAKLDENFKLGENVSLVMRIYHIGNEEIPHMVELKSIKKVAGNRQMSESGLKQIEAYKFTTKRIFTRGKK